MDRRLFLESIGIGAAFALTATCLQSCKHEPLEPINGTTNTNNGTTTTASSVTIDLNDAAYVGLKNNGGYIIVKGVVIARDSAGNLVAATQVCSHENKQQVYFSSVLNEFYCPAHGARFSTDGKGVNSNGRAGLTIYKTVLDGSILRIFK
jgi:cytochrome b6-f complex iron-sulfur subunit